MALINASIRRNGQRNAKHDTLLGRDMKDENGGIEVGEMMRTYIPFINATKNQREQYLNTKHGKTLAAAIWIIFLGVHFNITFQNFSGVHNT
uniref:Uncharacterized protein n=1 Tax=Glossina morsitans morsitans TaxID=37546 RepID=A0A1B0FET9_GLOMM